MDFELIGIGEGLTRPPKERLADATLATARRCAHRILDAHRACEAVEVFSAGRFVVEVKRHAAAGTPRAAWGGATCQVTSSTS